MEALDGRDLPETGGYILLLRLKEFSEIQIGRLGVIRFDSGYYAYIGSAMKGLRQRISRHLRNEKKLHWHIDYLLKEATVENVIVCQSHNKIECNIANEVGKEYKVINGFGSSDCRCPGHLYYSPSNFSNRIMSKLESADMRPQLITGSKDSGNQ
jgi:Uri superfamily endonuclease